MRLELSTKTDLAIQAIQFLTDDGDCLLASGANLAAGIGTSGHYLPQVMQPLVRNNWVESTPGRSGGYQLVASPDQISLLDVIEAVEGPAVDGRCVLRGAPCPVTEQCALHVPWTRARDALLSELGSTPVAEMGCRAMKEEANDV
jgi:Rrf2 family protein